LTKSLSGEKVKDYKHKKLQQVILNLQLTGYNFISSSIFVEEATKLFIYFSIFFIIFPLKIYRNSR